jgi:DNA-binding beta-propeller fold protein YncE
MTRSGLTVLAVAAAVLVVWTGVWSAEGPAPAGHAADAVKLQVLKPFVGGPAGRWDFLAVDPVTRRLYVAHETCTMVYDADSGAVVGTVEGTPMAHGVAVVPDKNIGFVTNGKNGTCCVFDLKTLKVTQKIKVGGKADAAIYDGDTKKVYVMDNGGGGVFVIDPATLDKDPVNIAVDGNLECAALDGAGRLYANSEDKNEVVVVDLKQQKVTAHWPLAPGEAPTGLAIDVAHHRLFSGCANKMMVILDSESGKVLGTVPIGAGVDGVEFDAVLGLAVSANGKEPTMTVVSEGPAGKFSVVQTLNTIKGAKTIAVDPKTHRFFCPCNVLTVDEKPQFGVVVVGPAPKP